MYVIMKFCQMNLVHGFYISALQIWTVEKKSNTMKGLITAPLELKHHFTTKDILCSI